jgi:hypothetical protein
VKKFVLPENKSVIDFRVMEEDAMEPGPGGGAPPTGIFGAAADDDALRRRLRFFLDIYGNNTNTNTIITIDYLSRVTLGYALNRPRNAFFSFRIP